MGCPPRTELITVYIRLEMKPKTPYKMMRELFLMAALAGTALSQYQVSRGIPRGEIFVPDRSFPREGGALAGGWQQAKTQNITCRTLRLRLRCAGARPGLADVGPPGNPAATAGSV